MKTTLLCFVFISCLSLFDAYHDDNYEFRCDYTYFQEAEGWFKLHEIPSYWQDARLRCQLEGAVLASPINTDIGVVMIKLKEKKQNTTVTGPKTSISVYTGIHATYSIKDYASIEGVPLSKIQHKWASGSPFNDLTGNVDSLIMGPDGSLSGVVGAETEFPFICYKKYEKLYINECGTVDNDYYKNRVTDKCYKFHHTAREWRKAYMTCAAEGSHLVVINSKEEAELVKTLISKNSVNSYREDGIDGRHSSQSRGGGRRIVYREGEEDEEQKANENIVHVGYTRAKVSKWLPMTIHGETLSEAGYSNIDKNKLHHDSNGYCGSMDQWGTFRHVDCNTMCYRFVCEKSPFRMTCL